MKILITGADGVLGSNLVRVLLSRNYEVSVLLENKNNSFTLDGLDITKVRGDILNPEDIDNIIKDKDIVIHCAANTCIWPPRSEIVNKTNINGTKNIINSVLKFNIKKLVYIGTANSFGFGSIENPGNETNPYLSKKYGLDYMDSKHQAQNLVLDAVRNQNLPAVVVNPTFIIGPFDSKPSSGAMILSIYKGKIPGYTKGGRNYIAAKDAAVGIANAITKGRIGECYILGNENLRYKEAFEKISKTIGTKPLNIKLPNFIVKSYGYLCSLNAAITKKVPTITYELSLISCENHYYSAQKAVEELDLPQTPIEVGIEECFKWFKENNYLDN